MEQKFSLNNFFKISNINERHRYYQEIPNNSNLKHSIDYYILTNFKPESEAYRKKYVKNHKSSLFIKDRETLDEYIGKHSNKPNIITLLQIAKENYDYIIDVMGYGSCYYRAVFGSLLYSIIFQCNDEDKNKHIIHLIELFFFFNEMKNLLIIILDNTVKFTDYTIFSNFLKKNDKIIVDALRTLLYINIKHLLSKNREKFLLNCGLFNEGENLDFFYKRMILDNTFKNKNNRHVDIEGIVVQYGLLPYILGSKSQIITYIDLGNEKDNYPIKITQFPGNNLPTINIILNNEIRHYQIFIPINIDKILQNMISFKDSKNIERKIHSFGNLNNYNTESEQNERLPNFNIIKDPNLKSNKSKNKSICNILRNSINNPNYINNTNYINSTNDINNKIISHINIDNVSDNDLSIYIIKNDGNCWYRALSMLLYSNEENYTLIRELSADNLSKKYIKYFANMTIAYYIYQNSTKTIGNSIFRDFKEMFNGTSYDVYKNNSKIIYDCLTNKEDITNILIKKNINIYDDYHSIWENINLHDKNKISNEIKKIVKKNKLNSPSVTYLNTVFELPNLLKAINKRFNINLILIEFNKITTSKFNNRITIYNDNKNNNYNNIRFGFLIGDENHTNIVYNTIYKKDNIPIDMKKYVDNVCEKLKINIV